MNLLSLFSGCGGMDIGFEGDFICLKKSINTQIHSDWIDSENGNWVKVKKTIFPKILISIFFDTCPEMNGDGTPDGSAADGFTFSIEFDEKFKECYQRMIDDDEIESLPIEFYQVKWITFSRASYYSSKFIGYKGLLINSDNFSSNNIYTSQIIKSYFDDDAAVRMSQAQRRMFDGFLQDSTVQDINTKILESDELKERKRSYS